MTLPILAPDLSALVALLLRATLMIGIAWAAAASLRMAGASAAARHMAWLLGIAGLLVLPLLWGLVPALRLPILPAGSAIAAAGPRAVAASPESMLGAPLSSEAAIDGSWVIALLAVYALGAATLLLRLFVGRQVLKRLWSDSFTPEDPAWARLVSDLSAEMRLSAPVQLRIARGPAVPMTWGTLAPKLLLPAEAGEWPLERRRLVLLHELAHVARRDSLGRSLASMACALYWFHPGAWFAARQMRVEQEHAADDRVLMAGGSPQAYALSLLHLAMGTGARPRFDQAAAMAGMYQLERRLVSITGAPRRNRPGTLFLSSSALLAGPTTLLVAAGVPVGATLGLPGSFRENRTDMVSTAEKAGDRGRRQEVPTRPERRESVSSEPTPEESRTRADPEPTQIAARRPPRSAGTVAVGREPENGGQEEGRDKQPPSTADVQQLRNYGWELRRRGPQVGTGSSADSSRSARIAVPAPLYSASSERKGPPKWAQHVPRLARGRPPWGGPPSDQGPLVVSWSIGVGVK